MSLRCGRSARCARAPAHSTSIAVTGSSGPPPARCVEVIPDKKLAFRVDTNHTIWSYELEPNGQGTRLVESRHAENGVTAFSSLSINALLGGTTKFESELVEGMQTSLAKIKAAAESA